MRRLAVLAIVIAAAALTATGQLTITSKSPLPIAFVGQPYPPVILQTANDPGPLIWTFDPDSFTAPGTVVGFGPNGQETTGTFCYGTPNGQGPPFCTGSVQFPGVYTFGIQARSLSTGTIASKQFTLAVVLPLQISTTTLPGATANQTYSGQLEATGGTGQFTWSVLDGGLPPGITLDAATGRLTGIAPTVDGVHAFTVQVLDQVTGFSRTQALTITVTGGLVITTTALPNGTLNQTYSFQLLGSGGQNLTWTVLQGSQLPPQFSLSPSGLLSGFGLNQNLGKYTFTIRLTDAQIPGAVLQTFTFYITLGPLSIQETALPNATQNFPYRATLTPLLGLPPYTWSLGIPAPPGLSIDRTSGTISGTLPNAGVFSVPVALQDSTGAVFPRTYSLTVSNTLSITTSALANDAPGVFYSDTLTAIGGTAPYRWEVIIGSLPTGLSLNPATGQISGTPTAPGPFSFTILVTDAINGVATKPFIIGPGPVITTISLPAGALTQPYSQTLGATGGLLPVTWTIASGTLPPPLALDAATGIISGTPGTLGTFAFDVLLTDAGKGVARKTFTIPIANPVAITSGNFTGNVLAAFSQTLTATGGTPPYTWSTSGTLPTGLQLNGATGVISGTPSAGGTNFVALTATDANGLTGSKTIVITIVLPATPTTSIGVGAGTGSGSQPAVSLTTSAPYPVEITGLLTLGFSSSAGGTDDMVRFSNGARTLDFIVRANTTQAIFPTATNAAVLTGTVAGTITLTASMTAGGQNITPSPAPTRSIVIDPAVPVITSVTLQQVTGGLSVVVTGYSNTREVSSGSFTFAVSSGNTLSQAQITVTLTPAFTTWFANSSANLTGGQFKLTVPFTVTGSATAITKVTVTLTNARGTSAAVSSP